jgi:hypothetical protein
LPLGSKTVIEARQSCNATFICVSQWCGPARMEQFFHLPSIISPAIASQVIEIEIP